MYRLSAMSAAEVAKCGGGLRQLGDDAVSMEDAASRTVNYLYQNLDHDQAGAKACTLIRFYKTHPFKDLDDELQAFAMNQLGDEPFREGMRCLTLLASAGENRQWNSRAESKRYKAIPLPSESFVASIPMLSRLVVQFGLDMRHLIEPDPAQFADQYDVFHVPEAVASPYIPAQDDFVIPYGVKSALGFGGLLATGELFAVILFAKVPISVGVAERFTPLALDIREAVSRFTGGPVFSSA